MPTLVSTLLGLSSVMDQLSELGPVKKHLFRAGREVLLAVQSLLRFVEEYVTRSPLESDQQQMVSGAISYAQKMIRTLVRQLPQGNEDEYRALHRKVMNSILEVLDHEIRTHSRKTTQKAKLKVEVFQAVRHVFLKEMYELNINTGGISQHDNNG